MQDYVEALIEPVSQRIRAGDVTLREYLERILIEYRSQMTKALVDANEIELQRIAALQRTVDERWDRVEEQLRSAVQVGLEAVEQLRRERILVTGAQQEAISKAEESVKLAIDKAEVATDKRFEAVNEFRAQQTDVIARFMPREVADAQFDAIRHTIAELTEKISKLA